MESIKYQYEIMNLLLFDYKRNKCFP